MKGCRRYEARIRDYIYGELPEGAEDEIKKHLEECEDCREYYQSEIKTKNMLKDFSTVERAGFVSSRGGIMSGIDKDRYGRGIWKRLQYGIRGGWRQAAGALVIVAIVLTGVLAVRSGNVNPTGKGNMEVKPDGEVSTDMNKAISDYFYNKSKTGYLSTDAWFEAHNILGQEEKKGFTRVYLYTFFSGYNISGNSFKEAAGGSLPVVIDIVKDKTGKYSVANYRQPGDGSYYTKDIKSMFPKRITDKVFDDEAIKIELQNDINRQAIEWLKAQNKEGLTIDYNYYFFEMPESIKIFKAAKEYTIPKGNPLFNEILYLTRTRFEYGKLSTYYMASSAIIDNIAKEDIVISFTYPKGTETTYRVNGGGVYKASYSSIYMPVKGDNSNYIAFEGGDKSGAVMGELKYSKELIDLAYTLDTSGIKGVPAK